MFGYVQAPGTAIAAIADLLASTLNANLTAWRSAPAAVEIERLTIDWIKQIIGFDPKAAGLFVSGGSMANMAGLAAARRAKAPPEISSEGAQSCSRALRVYASEEVHHSIAKAAALLGIGRDNVGMIGVDERYKINLDALVAAIKEDRATGHLPICVVANAGTVATGAFDSLPQISEIACRFNLWLHVDGAYGGFAALAAIVCLDRGCRFGRARSAQMALSSGRLRLHLVSGSGGCSRRLRSRGGIHSRHWTRSRRSVCILGLRTGIVAPLSCA
jgi:glutamate/tyrosine decarboxylase-like PLP-dependent enzyme